MTRIVRLQAENYKKLIAIDIRPGDGAVKIRGDNAQGKSSTLDAIQAAFGGKAAMPSMPVRAGEQEGAIQIELDDGVVILRRFTVDGKGDTIEVTNGDGFKAGSPQQLLNKLYSSVAFDPLAFTLAEADKQFAMLRSVVTLDVDLDQHAKADKADYEARTLVNRDIKTLEAQLPTLQPQGIVPDEPVDVAALQTRLAAASEHNVSIENRRNKQIEFAAALERNRATLAQLQEDKANIERQIAEYVETVQGQAAVIEQAPALPDPIDVAEVSAQLTAATAANEQFRKKVIYAAEATKLSVLRDQSAALTALLEDREKARTEAIAKADMPVEGLAFGDGIVLFGGVPLDQVSMSEKIRISARIGMALAPKLRVMLVRDASLLSEAGQEALETIAAENDFQLWIEAVDTSGKIGIVLEDGAVTAIDGEEAPAPKPIKEVRRRPKKQDAAGGAEDIAGSKDEDQGKAIPASTSAEEEGPLSPSVPSSDVIQMLVSDEVAEALDAIADQVADQKAEVGRVTGINDALLGEGDGKTHPAPAASSLFD
jgi:hypothetical protein